MADTSTPVPGGAPGEVFRTFASDPSHSGGRVAFVAFGDMGTRGLYTGTVGTLTAVADNSTPVPGGMPGELFGFFDRHSLSAGTVVFSGSGDQGTRGVYTDAGGTLAVVFDDSTPVPDGAPGELFDRFFDTLLSGCSVTFHGVGVQDTQGLYTDAGGALAALVDTSTLAPGGSPGELFAAFASPSISGGSLAFQASGDMDMGATGVYSDARGALALVADTTTQVPDGGPGEVFLFTSSPFLSCDSIAFHGLGVSGTRGIYTDAGGALATLVDTSTPVPGGAPGELFNVLGGPSCSGDRFAFLAFSDMGLPGLYLATTSIIAPPTSFTGPTGSGSGTVSFTGGAPGCGFTSFSFVPVEGHTLSPPAGTAPAFLTFPDGLASFVVDDACTPGFTATFTFTAPEPLPDSTEYWKYGPTPGNAAPHWYQMPATVDGNAITFSVTDGGLGDDDLMANGTIVDQGGPAVPAAMDIPSLSERSMALLGGLLALAGLALLRRRLG